MSADSPEGYSAWTAQAIAQVAATLGKDCGSRIVFSHDFVPNWPGRPRPNPQNSLG